MSEEQKIKIGTVLVFFQLCLLAMSLTFCWHCDRQLERDGISLEELTKGRNF